MCILCCRWQTSYTCGQMTAGTQQLLQAPKPEPLCSMTAKAHRRAFTAQIAWSESMQKGNEQMRVTAASRAESDDSTE